MVCPSPQQIRSADGPGLCGFLGVMDRPKQNVDKIAEVFLSPHFPGEPKIPRLNRDFLH